VYGANAMGGAINIVLKRDIGRPVLDVRYGSAEGGARERRVSLSSGYSAGRLRGSILLDYFDRGALLGSKRDRWADQDFRRFGGTDQRSTSTNPANVTSSTGGNLPGLSSPIAAVPEGSTGVGLTPADFAATAGQRNFDSLNRFRSIVGEQDRRNATAFGEFDLSPAVQAFAEFFHEESESAIHLPPAAATLLVPAANEFNPFDEPVLVSYLFTGVGPRKRFSEAESDRGLVGLRGDLNAWDWEVSAVRTQGDGFQRSPRNSVDFARVNAVLAAAPPDETLNVFQDGPGGSASLLASLLAPASIELEYSADTRLATAQLRGPLRQLPAGPLEIVVGGNAGEEEILFTSTSLVAPVAGDRTSSAAFAELGIPLVKPAMQVRGVSSLRLTGAVRYDDYSDFGDSLNPQFGLVWAPVDALSLRISHGTSFSPPNLFSLHAPLQQFPFFVTDPRRSNETAFIALIVGGNPDLQAVDGESLTAGFVLTPAHMPGFRFSANYWELEVDNRVTVVPPQQLVFSESLFPDRVIRGQPSPADEAAGLPGPIVSVDITRINFGRLKTSGIDWEASYSLDTRWGNFTPSILGTWTGKYRSVELPNTPAVERVGVASTLGTIPEWKLSATIAWTRANVGWSATARYIHSYDDAVFGLGPTGRRVDSQTLIDTQAFFNLGEMLPRDSAWFRGTRITAGITNLLDESPPFSELFFDSGYDNTQGDLVGRTGYLTLTKRF
jgi:iron complex outermembrane receptor protein